MRRRIFGIVLAALGGVFIGFGLGSWVANNYSSRLNTPKMECVPCTPPPHGTHVD